MTIPVFHINMIPDPKGKDADVIYAANGTKRAVPCRIGNSDKPYIGYADTSVKQQMRKVEKRHAGNG